ncbi:MAG: Si-specific NAD(P)(+) transhydrogenase [Candidatus Krumholzibacteriia bacterium]
MPEYDVVVIGGGPAGERAAIQAARAGRSTALVERFVEVGGTGVNWGAIPSKTLRESALFVHGLTLAKLDAIRCELDGEITIGDFMHRERVVVQRELELIHRALAKYGVELLRGQGRFVDPHTVAVESEAGETLLLHGGVIVIATGSSPNHPADVVFDGETVFDSAGILRLPRLPRSLIVLGAGVIGIEYASIFAALGIAVTLVDTRDRLLPFVDREIVGILEGELRRLGVTLLSDGSYRRIRRLPGAAPRVHCLLGDGRELEADAMLYCVGRDGNTSGLGLERAGLAPNARGLLEVDAQFRTATPHIFAVGDVIGYPALASTSMEQGRQAIRNAFGLRGPRAQTDMLPFAIYSIPEVSYIGETEDGLTARGEPFVTGRGRYELNPRGQILGDTNGLLKLLFRAGSLELAGVHIVGTGASELVHIGQAFLDCRADALRIAETIYNYPTLSDLYRHAALEALQAAGPR